MDEFTSATDAPASKPTPECLVDRLLQLHRYLSRRKENFSSWVIELAVDRVVRAALPYFKEKACKLPDEASRRRWIFGAALKAARQVAARQVPCDMLEPCKLEAIIHRRHSAEENQEWHNALYAAIDLLTPLQREAIDWCVIKGLSLHGAAERMKRSPNMVKCHRDAGLKRLKELLEETFVHLRARAFYKGGEEK